MNTERLNILSDHLHRLQKAPAAKRKREFSLSFWSCGTSACAVGEACFIQRFNKDGLRLNDGAPEFMLQRGWNAATLFFDIPHSAAVQLFSKDAYSRRQRHLPGAVARRIDALLAGKLIIPQHI